MRGLDEQPAMGALDRHHTDGERTLAWGKRALCGGWPALKRPMHAVSGGLGFPIFRLAAQMKPLVRGYCAGCDIAAHSTTASPDVVVRKRTIWLYRQASTKTATAILAGPARLGGPSWRS
jgi:hypothetical protein